MTSVDGGPSLSGGVDLTSSQNIDTNGEPPTISKNKLKKLRRDQAWAEGLEKRRELRKIKHKEKKERKRRENAALAEDAPASSGQRREEPKKDPQKSQQQRAVQLPITIIIDCSFDNLMLDPERKSLASQITRSYSDNHRAPFKSHLTLSSFGGHLKERFDTVLSGHHRNWKGVRFLEDDFPEAASQATEWMRADQGGKLAGAFAPKDANQNRDEGKSSDGEDIIYLTSDSPNTLVELKPYSTYIIGGLVDKNRHKGICYQRAMDRGFQTAKLSIGDFMEMNSRFVLTTNQVVEIMLKWLELGNWGRAFLEVIPKRKGGVLRNGKGNDSGDLEDAVADENLNAPSLQQAEEEINAEAQPQPQAIELTNSAGLPDKPGD